MELSKKERDLLIHLLLKEDKQLKKGEKMEESLPFLAAEEKYDIEVRKLIKKLS